VSPLAVFLRLSCSINCARRRGPLIEFALSGAFHFRRSAALISSALFHSGRAHRADCKAVPCDRDATYNRSERRRRRKAALDQGENSGKHALCVQSFSSRPTFVRCLFWAKAFFYLCAARRPNTREPDTISLFVVPRPVERVYMSASCETKRQKLPLVPLFREDSVAALLEVSGRI
jgi:hypothetical protein